MRVTRAGRPVQLSPTEFKLLRFLLVNRERVVSKGQILDHVWQYDFGGSGGVVENYISYLRKKVDDVEPRLIHTVRGLRVRPPHGAVAPGAVTGDPPPAGGRHHRRGGDRHRRWRAC